MPTTMSKFLMLGVPIERVVAMSTSKPAKTLGLQDQIGTLKVGTGADITVLEQLEGGSCLQTATASSAPATPCWWLPRPSCGASFCLPVGQADAFPRHGFRLIN